MLKKKVENRNFDIRKQLLEYDDIINEQRCIIYSQRNKLIDAKDIKTIISDILEDVLTYTINVYFPKNTIPKVEAIISLEEKLNLDFHLKIPILNWLKKDLNLTYQDILKKIINFANINYQNKEKLIGENNMRIIEKSIMLETLDSLWTDHLSAIDYLRKGIHLRGYAQKDPKQEYKRESFNMFSNMLTLLKHEVISFLSKIDSSYLKKYMNFRQGVASSNFNSTKISRNTLCICGSGKKYKHCHGIL